MKNFDENNEYLQTLEDNIYDFKLNRIFANDSEGNFILFTYNNDALHRSIETYHHTDTDEFRVQINFGFNSFCLSDFFTTDFNVFVEKLKNKLPDLLEYYSSDVNSDDELILAKNFKSWQYGNKLPNKINDFELFIKPAMPFEITNGSFVIIDYCNFETKSDFVVYYNLYRDDYGAEFRTNGVTNVLSEFDTDDLKVLQSQLELHLNKYLQSNK